MSSLNISNVYTESRVVRSGLVTSKIVHAFSKPCQYPSKLLGITRNHSEKASQTTFMQKQALELLLENH